MRQVFEKIFSLRPMTRFAMTFSRKLVTSRIRYWVTSFSQTQKTKTTTADTEKFSETESECLFIFRFSVVFKNQKCLDCGLTGDVRLMSNYCHMEKVFVHPGSLIQYHPKRTERYHDSTTVIREHPGGLYRPWYSLDFFICKMGGERYFLSF